MANNNEHINYSKADIEKYLQGKMNAAEMYALEKAALQDPFLADAIEGFEIANMQQAKEAIADTNFLIQTSTQPSSNTSTFTINDFEKYFTHQLSNTERHTIEKAALTDPLVNDAMEGYENTNFELANKQLAIIQQNIQGTQQEAAKVITMTTTNNSKQWLRIAAAIIIMVGVGSTIWLVNNNNSIVEKPIAYIPNEVIQAPVDVTTKEVTTNNKTTTTVTIPEAVATKPSTQASAPTLKLSIDEVAGLTKDNATNTATITESNTQLNAPKAIEQEDSKALLAKEEALRKQQSNDLAIADKKKETAKSAKNVTIATPSIADNEITRNNNTRAYNNQNASPNVFRGRVLNNNGEALAATTLSVRNSNTNILARTDNDGNFSVQLPDTNAIVSVETSGYAQQQLNLSANRSNNIVLEKGKEETSLAETVVVAYGTAKAKTANAATQKVTQQEMLNGGIEPLGGWKSFNQYLEQKLAILKLENEGDIEDESSDNLTINFKVKNNGEPTNINVKGAKNNKVAQKAAEIIEQGPKWKYSKKNKKVKLVVQL
ncbi:MAG: carboxypeptidase-like regulatory domain-containing protein [Chitinophagaceae bacterium]|nr:carboxypeptidase-like regulatory domain-containing protein [Chitinophagaceae bacterium]MBP9740872.1 carboxypeptidase-like regulatory domain-containing protein [Chitinophagaceae bacterium]